MMKRELKSGSWNPEIGSRKSEAGNGKTVLLPASPARHERLGPGRASFWLPRSTRFHSQAFTLIELMLVIIIIGALAAMVMPRLVGRSEEARRGVAEAAIKGTLALALKLYEVDNGHYPTTEQGLNALLTKPTSPPTPPNWKGPYLEQEPLDPWKRPYVYRYPGTHPPRDFDLSSLGPDGVESQDDITNW